VGTVAILVLPAVLVAPEVAEARMALTEARRRLLSEGGSDPASPTSSDV
jgi:hypothetical protein